MLPDLAEYLAAEPLDESWHLLRLRALHASGRTAEALLAYDSFRGLLADELGADPGPALRAVHGELLAATAPSASAPGPSVPLPAAAGPVVPTGPGAVPAPPSAAGLPRGAGFVGAAVPRENGPWTGGATAEAAGSRSSGRAGSGAERVGLSPGGLHAPSSARPAPPVPPATPAPSVRGNLPRRLTSFVGRESELDALRQELPGARVLTLTGPGGTGKTRLAQQAAGAAAGAYPDGVWQVELAPLDDPRGVVDAALGALGLRATHLGLGLSESLGAPAAGAAAAEGERPLARLLEFCGPRTLLLVLDNCEHLVQAAAELAESLAAACPGVTVLATSREPLGVPGELVRPVEPLPEPTALLLLAERGAAARPGFDPTDPAQGPDACAEICRRLDGLPLAIELAAARLRAMTPRQLADRLDRRFTLLTGGNRTDLPRRQTLRAVVDWSWELLEKSERTLLARLSVFSGGWTLEAAEAICSDGDDLPVQDVAPCLLSLVDKSLIQADLTTSNPEPRYRMLETIHEYAVERLPETADPNAPGLAHLRWFRELARVTDPLLRSAAQLQALRLLDTEHDNLRAALRRAVETGEEQEALSLLCNLGWYWMLRNQRDEAREFTRAVRALIPGDPFDVPAVPVPEGPCDLPPPWPQPVLEEARRVASTGVILTGEGSFGGVPDDDVRRLGARIVDCYRPELPQSARLPALQRVYVVMFAGLLEQLPAVADGAVEGCRRFGRPWELACALQIRAKLLNDQPGNRERAAMDAAESLELFDAIGDRWGRAEAYAGLAEIAIFAGDFEEGVRCCREAMALAQEIGADQEEPILRVRLGDALLGLGRIEEGEAELLRGIADARAYGLVGQGAGMFGTMLLASLRMHQQRLAEARELLEELLGGGTLSEGAGGLLTGLVNGLLGSVDAMDGDPEGGLRRIRAGLEEMRTDPLIPFASEQLPLVLIPALAGTLWRYAAVGAVPQERPALTAVTLLGAYTHLQSRSAAHHLDRAALGETAAGLRALLGDAAFEAAHREGTTLDASAAVALIYGD